MRVRKRKHGETRIAACDAIVRKIEKDAPTPINLHEVFPNAKSFRIEIGCGKGAFITQMAKKHPDVGFIAVEKISDVLLIGAEKVLAEELPNVLFLNGDAACLPAVFPEKQFERIYINFCDPWPKARHAKRRLTYAPTLTRFSTFLKDDGVIEFKTDNRPLFDFSLEEFVTAGFTLRAVTNDLHASEWATDNIMTEYEANFSAKGFKINRLEAFLQEK